MTARRTLAVISALALLGGLTACSAEEALPTNPAETEAPIGEPGFHFRVSADGISVLMAPANAGAGWDEHTGVIKLAGTCLGFQNAAGKVYTVVWPNESLVLKNKVGVEIPGSQIAVQARFLVGDAVTFQGGYYSETSWIGSVPAGCTMNPEGVFVATTAQHPPAAESDTED